MVRLFFFLILAGCSGYRLNQQDNPLAQYGVESLSVPMFHNFSNQPDVAGLFTRETYRLLTGFKGLKIQSGHNPHFDALLIGIIKSPRRVNETLAPNNLRVANEKAPEAIGNSRDDFYIPGTTDVTLMLHVIVIKKPTSDELALLKSGIGDKIRMSSRIIFNEIIPLRTQFTREIFDNEDVSITATQNAGIQRKVLKKLSEQAAASVRDMIFYAF
jgi:hypothetical protein